MKPIIAITMGDPTGIGAEIAVRALAKKRFYEEARPLVIGARGPMEDGLRMVGSDLKLNIIDDVAQGRYEYGTIDLLDLDNVDMDKLVYGKVAAMGGKAAFEYIIKGIDLAVAGIVDAVVTGPIHKEALNQAGHHYSGHTEIFAEKTGTKDYSMMLAHKDFRVAHVTTHVSLRQACDLVKKERVGIVIRLAHDAMLDLGIEKPRIGVAGLNPHSGEGGLFGDEEIKEIIPAIEEARAEGMDVEGPVPPDTLFAKALGGQYDIVVAMYHDQGHIPMKTAGFELDLETNTYKSVSGVNITLGLPIIRTSVDHGTAFGKAGQGRANSESLEEAIDYAIQFARGKKRV
ncbi:MAG: 4-hydroxythreonine-4-phosphate dehydrogenase PdxA [Firmicutes bacterium]|jgi:4-hydroxythreonine-4-phosphate dehydrogenase|nr:4-hydroxythreonine-4-phosphate dehydrogenase PdxA [Bacillota bacterium]